MIFSIQIMFCFLLIPLYFPHFLAYVRSSKQMTILEEIELNAPRQLLRHPRFIQLIWMLHFDRYFISLFFHRIKEQPLRHILFRRSAHNFIIPYDVILGDGLKYDHPFSTILNAKSIGKGCRIKNTITIGNKNDNESFRPVIGDNVYIGVNAVVIGDIKIGDNCIIGAGTILTKDIPDNHVVIGGGGIKLWKR